MPTIEQLERMQESVGDVRQYIELDGCCAWSKDQWEEGEKGKKRNLAWVYNFDTRYREERDINETMDSDMHPELRAVCVSGVYPVDPNRFSDEGRVITDAMTGLAWHRQTNGKAYDWQEAPVRQKGSRSLQLYLRR